MKKKIVLGDIFEIETKKGKGFMQYVKEPKNNTRLEKVRIFYDLHKDAPKELSTIVGKDSFYLSFPIKSALNKNILKYVGNVPLPLDFIFPKYFRTENIFGSGWSIINIEGGQSTVEELSDKEIMMSPWGTWNDTLLIDNLEKGWRLENWK